MNRLSLWMCAALGLSLLSTAGCRTREIELAARFGHHESTQLLAVAKLEAKGAGGAQLTNSVAASGRLQRRLMTLSFRQWHEDLRRWYPR